LEIAVTPTEYENIQPKSASSAMQEFCPLLLVYGKINKKTGESKSPFDFCDDLIFALTKRGNAHVN